MRFRSRALAPTLALSLSIGLLGSVCSVVAAQPATAPVAPLYSPDSDPMFAQPYIDIDEQRDAPVRQRYVHGGFKGTETRFSFYFPPQEQYHGRFFQHITPAPDSENLAQLVPAGEFNKIGSSIAAGAYFVETNGGGKIDMTKGSLALSDPLITAYKANAAAAAYSRKIAVQMYGGKRPYGYAYGGSGGAYRTIGSIENTHGVWDGVVPYVPGSYMAIPNMFTVRMQALRVLRDKFPQIVDAEEPGGSGNPYAGLNPREAAVLHEVEQMGFPMKSWFGYKTMGLHGFAALYGGVVAADPSFFTDFWTKPGYLGRDHPEYFTADRIQYPGTVAEVITAQRAAELGLSTDPFAQANRGGVDTSYKGPPSEANNVVGIRLSAMPPQVYFLGGDLLIASGGLQGRRLTLSTLKGDVVMLGVVNPQEAARLKAGDQVTVDNSNFLAMETYHRHQVPTRDFKVWDQFRKADGTPLFPQRPMLLGPLFTKSTAGSLQTGRFEGKMILAASLWDREAMPWQADWYRERVREHLGGRTDQNFRLWYTDHALHGDEPTAAAASRIVTYVPTLQQALSDLAAWVEQGTPPPASSVYRIAQGQVVPAPAAAQRLGIQPVVKLQVRGGQRAEVSVGQSVAFSGTIAVPPGGGSIVAAEWDFDGLGKFPASSPVASGAKRATVTIMHQFDQPGTYFVALRGVSQRREFAETPYARIRNLDRVRVVVK
ncbi:MAG: hypothetical protein JWQ16_1887 [Novosphingobium sp.]|nr:hypothetical protein [Novosphingobium sp.]